MKIKHLKYLGPQTSFGQWTVDAVSEPSVLRMPLLLSSLFLQQLARVNNPWFLGLQVNLFRSLRTAGFLLLKILRSLACLVYFRVFRWGPGLSELTCGCTFPCSSRLFCCRSTLLSQIYRVFLARLFPSFRKPLNEFCRILQFWLKTCQLESKSKMKPILCSPCGPAVTAWHLSPQPR